MKVFSISLILLLFAPNLICGYSISKAQRKPPHIRRERNETDVYVVNEGRNTVRIVYPKAEKPTLREIVYYHVIETPYDDKKKTEENSDGPDFDETRRPFTNSHGFQFLPAEVEVTDSKLQEQHDEKRDGNDDKNWFDSEDEDVDTTDMGEFIDEENSTQTTTTNNKNAGVSDEAPEEDSSEISEEEEAAARTTTERSTSTTSTSTARSETVEDEKKTARNQLFGQVKRRYENIRRSAKPIARSRRDVETDKIPDAPRLPEFNIDSLPEYIRKLIATEPEPKPKLQQFNEDEFKEELNEKIEEMLATIKPDDDDSNDDDANNDDDDDDDANNDDDETVEPESDVDDAEKKRVPRTYGMKLTKDHGYVWNDLWSKKGMLFDVGDSESEDDSKDNTDIEKPEKGDIPKDQDIVFTEILHPTESRPLYNLGNKHDTDKNLLNNNDGNKPNKEGNNQDEEEDIFVTPKMLLKEDSSTKKEGEKQKEVMPESNTKETIKKEVDGLQDNGKGNNESEMKPNVSEKDGNIRQEARKVEMPELLQDLMKNEQFWKWLSDWTATYMELLIKHIKRTVHDEVSRQINKLSLDLKKKESEEMISKEPTAEITKEQQEIKVEDEARDVKKDKSSQKLKDTDKPAHKIKSFDKDTAEITKEQQEIKVEDEARVVKKDKSEELNDTDKPALKRKSSDKDTTNTRKHIKNNEISIDDNKIPKAHTTNTNNHTDKGKKELKHKKEQDNSKKDKEKDKVNITSTNADKNKETAPIQVTAHNIFGNSVGDGKVVNIFIFNPTDDDEDDVIEEALNNGTTNVSAETPEIILDERFKPEIVEHKEENTESHKVTPKPENLEDKSTQTDNLEEKDKATDENDKSEGQDTETHNLLELNKETEKNEKLETFEQQKQINKKESEKPKVKPDSNDNTTPDKNTKELNEKRQAPIFKDDKLIIDGKEIPITHTTNFDTNIEELSKLKSSTEKTEPDTDGKVNENNKEISKNDSLKSDNSSKELKEDDLKGEKSGDKKIETVNKTETGEKEDLSKDVKGIDDKTSR